MRSVTEIKLKKVVKACLIKKVHHKILLNSKKAPKSTKMVLKTSSNVEIKHLGSIDNGESSLSKTYRMKINFFGLK